MASHRFSKEYLPNFIHDLMSGWGSITVSISITAMPTITRSHLYECPSVFLLIKCKYKNYSCAKSILYWSPYGICKASRRFMRMRNGTAIWSSTCKLRSTTYSFDLNLLFSQTHTLTREIKINWCRAEREIKIANMRENLVRMLPTLPTFHWEFCCEGDWFTRPVQTKKTERNGAFSTPSFSHQSTIELLFDTWEEQIAVDDR